MEKKSMKEHFSSNRISVCKDCQFPQRFSGRSLTMICGFCKYVSPFSPIENENKTNSNAPELA